MKKWILSLGVLLVLGSCKTDSGNNGEAAAGAAGATAPTTTPAQSMNGAFQPPTPPEDSKLVQTLTKDYWVFEFYVVDDRAQRRANKGRWVKFMADGTFESGQWQQKTGYGSWRISENASEITLSFDNIDDRQDEQWEIQGVNQSMDTMTWAGIPKTKTEGAIIKVISLLTMPTKKQFGVED
ncbi:hypothetical protein [Phaeodactylibacter luteus]|uniref:Lipoprotein n=1 Tax=Phaeodactylibacter luteus TaxID=1564516 RepID=A0A5C6RJ32_9BACT|nr:hypothetical protein [Phaeodactylibacter luteus]TXB62207.1 hypothetical protein FRY97_15265 [Phaeodactylibacter luteus]